MSFTLLEGMSIRSVERVTAIHRDTILSLLVLAGERCQNLMYERIKSIDVKDVQVDEIWGYVFKKEGHKWNHEKDIADIGDAYCFVAMERNTKLVLTYHLGKRDALSTDTFIHKLLVCHWTAAAISSPATASKPTSRPCKFSLSGRVHFAQLVKVYGADREGEQRYSPGEVVDAVPYIVSAILTGTASAPAMSSGRTLDPHGNAEHDAADKWIQQEVGELQAAYALWFAYYNFCRRHQTLRVTPAMESGLTDHVWSIRELVAPV